MPLPAQRETRSRLIKRYSQVDACYFAWYSIALSKMQRANRQDVLDAQLLARQGFINLIELERLQLFVATEAASLIQWPSSQLTPRVPPAGRTIYHWPGALRHL